MYLSLTPHIDPLAGERDHFWQDQHGEMRCSLSLGDDIALFGYPLELIGWLRRRADELEAKLAAHQAAEPAQSEG